MLSIQGTVWNTGDPVSTSDGHTGVLSQGKTGEVNLKGSRESDSLIVVMKLTKGVKISELVERRGELSMELVLGKQQV